MSQTTAMLCFLVAESIFLAIGLRFFKIDFDWWQVVLASFLAALCMAIPNGSRGPISFIVMLATLRYFTGASWSDLFYPVGAARLATIPVMMVLASQLAH